MGSIYAKAVHVIAWVWLQDESRFPSRVAELAARILTHERWSSKDFTTRGITHNGASSFELLEGTLVKPSYWSRRWIIQELVLAKDVTLMFNSISIPLSSVHQFLQKFSLEDFNLFEPFPLVIFPSTGTSADTSAFNNREGLRRMTHLLQKKLEKSGVARLCQHRIMRSQSDRTIQTWSACLKRYHDWNCGDSHDILYALQALINEDAHFNADYTLSPVQLIQQAVQVVKEQEQLNPINCFLVASLLLEQMSVDLDSEILRILQPPYVDHNLTISIQVPARLRGFITRHVSDIELNHASGWQRMMFYEDQTMDTNERQSWGAMFKHSFVVIDETCREKGF
jgi:hypothetical protein